MSLPKNNAQTFVRYYNKIDDFIRVKYNRDRRIGFRRLLKEVRIANKTINKYYDVLSEYAELRNAIVHGDKDEKVLAEPYDDVVNNIIFIYHQLSKPPKVYPRFKTKVVVVGINELILDAINIMGKTGYSQIPIIENKNIIGLLSPVSLLKWLKKVPKENKEGKLVITGERVKDLIPYLEITKNFIFLKKDATYYEVIEKFELNNKLESILITASGKEDEELLGIITAKCLLKINNELKI